ncbi:uncharacterized protein LOC119398840 [Rhipicephalus sanguineus]|uniref:uncharacterized protein LOC119398840 n=1 Tax=Rhipicephalus sanguineus TaxID=34632 RepID=UPI001893212F|nr:uncharacterized protein LOC119398840 [Rhipicephalus sanguineus]
MHDDLAGRTQVYSDGSVLRDRSAAAACIAPELGKALQCRLSFCASSTTAEIVGLQLAADLLHESPTIKNAAIYCDSRSALRQLMKEERGSPLSQRVAHSLRSVQEHGCDVVLQWLPSHVGIAGNEAADDLAKQAHSSATPLTPYANSLDSARCNFRRELQRDHPDERVADGRPPPLLPIAGFSRRERALLFSLRTGSAWTGERKQRLRGAPSSACIDCGAVETLFHLLCECPTSACARKQLATRYRLLGLPCETLEGILFPTGCSDRRRNALSALLSFIDAAGLGERL